jgi:hypothetical protein
MTKGKARMVAFIVEFEDGSTGRITTSMSSRCEAESTSPGSLRQNAILGAKSNMCGGHRPMNSLRDDPIGRESYPLTIAPESIAMGSAHPD